MPLSTLFHNLFTYTRPFLFAGILICSLTLTRVARADNPPVVRFGLSSANVTLGEPVMLWMDCRNDSDRAALVDLGANSENNVIVHAAFPDGRRQELRHQPEEGLASPGWVRLAPHSSVRETVLLNRLVDLGRPGLYTLQFQIAASTNPTVNADRAVVENDLLQLFVDSRNERVLTEKCRELVTLARSGRGEHEHIGLMALGYTRDPVAVPFLEAWVQSGKNGSDADALWAFQALGMIGGDEAARFLLAQASVPYPAHVPTMGVLMARGVLQEMASSIVDAKLRDQAKHKIDEINADWLQSRAPAPK